MTIESFHDNPHVPQVERTGVPGSLSDPGVPGRVRILLTGPVDFFLENLNGVALESLRRQCTDD